MDLLKKCLVLCLASVTALAGAKSSILIDRSGSMRPYYQDKTVAGVGEMLLESLRAHGEVGLYAFSDQAQVVKSLAEIDGLPYGSSTLMDRALERAMKDGGQFIWMITDNIQDPPGSKEAGETEQFYNKLRSDAIERVTIFPLRQPAGRPGIVIYSLMVKGADSALHEKGLASFHSRATQQLRTDALTMKPLDRDTVVISWVRANVNPRTSLITYDTGKPVKEELQIKFKSKFDHIEIQDSSIEVAQGEASFGPGSLVYPERRRIDISPRKVERLGAGAETAQVYRVDVDLGALKLRNDLVSLWNAAWVKSSENATLQLAFTIRVPQQNFRLRPEFLQKFHAGTVEEARNTGKLYAVNRLPSLMSNEVTEVQVSSPVVFRVKYPFYPTILWMSVFAFGGIVLVGLLIFAKRAAGVVMTRNWDVEAKTKTGATVASSVDGDKVLVQRDVVGQIQKGDFQPGTGVRIVQPSVAQVKIEDGLELTLEARRTLYVLKFKSKKSVSAPAITAAAPPPKRR